MKQTRNLLMLGAVAFMACVFTACGGTGSGAGSAVSEAADLPIDGILGELPKAVADFEAAEAAASAKYDELKKSDPEKAREFWSEYIGQGNTTKFKKETLPAIEKTLEGKEIPAELADGLPLQLDGNFKLDAKREARVSGTFTAGASNHTQIMTLKPVAFDSDGNPIAIASRGINFNDYPIQEGKAFTFAFYISVSDYDAAGWAKLQKIVIMDRESEAFKQAEAQIEATKEAFKNKAEGN
ncbi:MAG: hypothetical protein IKO12_00265 [Bacteroidaceae bacterium]|nr:hypothetical protein [Bacteroidaceae bacterium]